MFFYLSLLLHNAIHLKHLFPQYSIGHFINQPKNKTEFEITRFDFMEEPDVEDVHKHSFYEILWVDAGLSRQTIDFYEYELKPQSLFFISPGQVHEFEEWQPLSGGTILFTEDFFRLQQANHNQLFEFTFLDNVYSNPNLQLSAEAYQEVRHTIELLISEKQRADCQQGILQSLLHILLLQIQRYSSLQDQHPIPSRYLLVFKQFRRMVEKEMGKGLTAREYADILHVSQHHLNRIVKEVSGKTATDLIRGQAMLEAKRMLAFSDMTVNEIAESLCFFDSSYFSKQFRKETGLSPLEFRIAMSEKYRTR